MRLVKKEEIYFSHETFVFTDKLRFLRSILKDLPVVKSCPSSESKLIIVHNHEIYIFYLHLNKFM